MRDGCDYCNYNDPDCHGGYYYHQPGYGFDHDNFDTHTTTIGGARVIIPDMRACTKTKTFMTKPYQTAAQTIQIKLLK